MRIIDDVLYFRSDLSPFLTHLTRDLDGTDAKTRLHSVLSERKFKFSGNPVSDAQYGRFSSSLTREQEHQLFGAVCFTETPLAEIHALLDIASRWVELRPYGLVFVKERLQKRGVSPVVYLNNERGDTRVVLDALCGLAHSNPDAAAQFIPLLSGFGKKWNGLPDRVDWYWEREWRYAPVHGELRFNEDEVFIGLCPDEEIDEFERKYRPFKFVDPRRNMKWYASKLIEERQRLDLKFAVV